jgi:hypothetical protein
VYGAELTDEEADALRAALILCATDPDHILNTAQEVDDWMQRDDAAATYGELGSAEWWNNLPEVKF